MTPRLVALSSLTTLGPAPTLERFAELGRMARPGSVVFQLRDLELSARERLRFGEALGRVARETNQYFLVNDRADLARLLDADGMHLGEAGIETSDARRLLSDGAFVSRAAHDPSLVAGLDADAVLLSPILEPRKGRPALGHAGLRAARAAVESAGRAQRIFALGGISSAGAAACLDAGADGVAVLGAVLSGDGAALVRALGIAR